MKELAALNKYFLRYKWHLLLGTVFVIISNLFGIIPAQIVRLSFELIGHSIKLYKLYEGFEIKPAVEDLFYTNVFFYGSIILVMALVRGAFLFMMRQTIIVMSRLVEFDQKNDIFAHYQTLPLSFYRRNHTGDLITRISEDVSKVRMYTGPAIMYGLNMITLVTIIIIYMVNVNLRLTLMVLAPLPLLSISIYFINNLINKYSDQIQQSLSILSTRVQETFSGIRVVKAFAREDDVLNQYAAETNQFRQRSLQLAKVSSLFGPLIVMLIGASTIFTVWAGGIEVMNGRITVGNIAEFVIYVNMLTWPVASLGWVLSIIQGASASQRRINEFLNEKNDLTSNQNLTTEIKGSIEFNKVTFTYPHTGITAIKDFSFQIEQGKTLAIFGNTGSGKSTVAQLISRLYDPSAGNIQIDKIDIKDYNPMHLRKAIGYVPQDVFLFSDTIYNNLIFGLDHKPSDEQINEALDIADLLETVKNFPDGLNTLLGERGINLSGGQKQRLSLARALVLRPKILILDDVLSAVDTNTEYNILNKLKQYLANCTAIIISHRVSSARMADTIIVVDDGQIVQKGNHNQLSATDGLYRAMYERQHPEEVKA